MGASFTFDGLEELKQALRNLPKELAEEASTIVQASGRDAMANMNYPERSGNLKGKLKMEATSEGPYGAGVVVKNTDPIAYVFENGSQARHTAIGANRGAMPPGHVFVPAITRARRVMYEKLKALLVEHGLTVTGDE